jgi:hypothetical protein
MKKEKVRRKVERKDVEKKCESSSPTKDKWKSVLGRNMEIKCGSKTFSGIITNIMWAGGMFFELDDGAILINTHKIEYAEEIGE